MLILGAKFKFSVSHRKFNFPLYAYIVCVIRSNSCSFFCHRDNNRSRLEKVPRLHYSLKKFCIFFDRYAKKWFQERQKCEDLSADRCFLLSIPYFFVFAGADGTFFLGCWAWYCHKFLWLCTSSTLACRRTQPACAFTRPASSALSYSFS